jgi:hypothetical protein
VLPVVGPLLTLKGTSVGSTLCNIYSYISYFPVFALHGNIVGKLCIDSFFQFDSWVDTQIVDAVPYMDEKLFSKLPYFLYDAGLRCIISSPGLWLGTSNLGALADLIHSVILIFLKTHLSISLV